MDSEEFLERHQSKLGSQYEVRFVREVLSRVGSLDFEAVRAQHPFRDLYRSARFIDFTIEEGPHVRLALEVDGYNKDGVSPGMSPHQFLNWQRRERGIVADGWRLLRFANSEIDRSPAECARHIELLLQQLRGEAAVLETNSDRYDVATELSQRIGRLRSSLLEVEGQLARSIIQGELPGMSHSTKSPTSRRSVGNPEMEMNKQVNDLMTKLSEAQHQLAEAVARRGDSKAEDRLSQLRELERRHAASRLEFERELEAAVTGKFKAEELARLESERKDEAMKAREQADRALDTAMQEKSRLVRDNRGVLVGLVSSLTALLVVAIVVLLVVTRDSEDTATLVPEVISLSPEVAAGSFAELEVATEPRGSCSLIYFTPLGTRSGADGLGGAMADEDGRVKWRWRIGSETNPGLAEFQTTCLENTTTRTFRVTR